MKDSTCLPIQEISQVGDARRVIGAMAAEAGLSETSRGQIAIIVNELGGNLVKHTGGRGGCLVFRALGDPARGRAGMEILSLDQGPGMADVSRCLSDGYSTAGSPGTGLGAVVRLSSVFDIQSTPGLGTAILAQVSAARSPENPDPLEIGAVCVPVGGETLCGDAWETAFTAEGMRFVVADGLGHGPLAHEASHAAIRNFRDHADLTPAAAIQSIHLALRSTRGAAVASARLDTGRSIIHYSGVGNIVGVVLGGGGEHRRMVSHNGTAGVQANKIHEFDYPWTPESTLILHSDGISTHWALEKYPGLLRRHPSIIAGVLYRDFARGRDDATVLVARAREVGP